MRVGNGKDLCACDFRFIYLLMSVLYELTFNFVLYESHAVHSPSSLPPPLPSPLLLGGGGILVPIFILVMGFSPKYAIPLSNVTILGGSIMNMVMNVSKRHPSADRPLVDWDLILIMEPLTIGGALAGSFLNKILPEWLLVVALVILLSYTAQTTLNKGFKVYQKESEAKTKAA